MKEVKNLAFKIIKISILLAFGLIIISYLAFDESKPIILGITFGALLGALNFYDLTLTIIKASTMNYNKARSFVTIRYIIRYFLVGITLLISIKADYIHVVGTILGLILI
ncbi:MAG: ATP synthase subunit I, partial [Clostridiales bacterium]|nr:ATP synthase subunit I [Clostridiales bacterium]